MTPRIPMRWSAAPTALLVATLLSGTANAGPVAADGPQVPVALAWGPDGLLRVALRDARQLATVDPKTWSVVSRRPLPFRPASLAYAAGRSTLVVGGTEGELLAVGLVGETMLNSANGRGPARVLALEGSRVAVSSTWDTSLRVVDVTGGRTLQSVALPFAPGSMVVRGVDRLIVADAFGGRLADVDLASGRVRVRTLDGVNLHALALSGDGKELLVGHMTQYGSVPVNGSNVDWGLVLSSRLSAVRLSDFEQGRDGDRLERRTLTLDGSRHGSADPSALAVSPDGGVILIALSAAHQILKNDRRSGSAAGDAADLMPLGHNRTIGSVDVGRNPVALLFDPTGEMAVTADMMSDTLTVVRVADLSTTATVRLGDAEPTRTAVQRGEALFNDGRRSLDRWMSCASCHAGGHTNGLNFDTLGDGDFGAAKNTPSLRGVGPTAPFAWTGRFATLEEQVHQSLRTSLRGPAGDDATVADLVAYLGSLTPPPPRRSADDPALVRGAVVFQARRCQTCHKPPFFTSPGVKDVGTDDGDGGHAAFNPPSLRGVGWSAPYLHDGSAATLDDLLDLHGPGQDTPLPAADRNALKAYLESL